MNALVGGCGQESVGIPLRRDPNTRCCITHCMANSGHFLRRKELCSAECALVGGSVCESLAVLFGGAAAGSLPPTGAGGRILRGLHCHLRTHFRRYLTPLPRPTTITIISILVLLFPALLLSLWMTFHSPEFDWGTEVAHSKKRG